FTISFLFQEKILQFLFYFKKKFYNFFSISRKNFIISFQFQEKFLENILMGASQKAGFSIQIQYSKQDFCEVKFFLCLSSRKGCSLARPVRIPFPSLEIMFPSLEIMTDYRKLALTHKIGVLAEVKKWTYQNRPIALKARQARKTRKIYLAYFGKKLFESHGPDL
ncbi:MAG: hypothetical protein PHW56_08920, partial [Methanosarcinaceae archaeon]|nr:hypothetical protein [Methanosarcinaceae archaeon]